MATSRESSPSRLHEFVAETLRGTRGFFRVGRDRNGRWWFIGPHDRSLFVRSVAGVGQPEPHQRRWAGSGLPSGGGGDSAAFAREAGRRLLGWGFNTLGAGSDPELRHLGLHQIGVVDFLQAGAPVLHAHGLCLPDVFDPAWPAFCEARAQLVTLAWRGNVNLVGLHTDTELQWAGSAAAGRPLGLLQICLSLEPAYAVHHAAWEFVLAAHGGELTTLGRAWGIALSHRGDLRQRTQAEQPIDSAGFSDDDHRFTREFARRYFQTTVGALRRHDHEHLMLGARFAAPAPPAVLMEAGGPLVDVLAVPPWSDVAMLLDQPQLWVNLGLCKGLARTEPTRLRVGPTRLERRLATLRRTIGAAATEARVVGYEWARWSDEPGETPPFASGLVHLDGTEARGHTELLTPLNTRAETRRRRA